jgi:undecaprenyl pyrophosphate synthase
MFWDHISSRVERFVLHVLASGPIPQHVAFVMDGNRRYARKERKQTIQGHTDGFMALRRVRVDPMLGHRTLRLIECTTDVRYLSQVKHTMRQRVCICY